MMRVFCKCCGQKTWEQKAIEACSGMSDPERQVGELKEVLVYYVGLFHDQEAKSHTAVDCARKLLAELEQSRPARDESSASHPVPLTGTPQGQSSSLDRPSEADE